LHFFLFFPFCPFFLFFPGTATRIANESRREIRLHTHPFILRKLALAV
jgi:hypothetical protein